MNCLPKPTPAPTRIGPSGAEGSLSYRPPSLPQRPVGIEVVDVAEVEDVVYVARVLREGGMPIGDALPHAVDHGQQS